MFWCRPRRCYDFKYYLLFREFFGNFLCTYSNDRLPRLVWNLGALSHISYQSYEYARFFIMRSDFSRVCTGVLAVCVSSTVRHVASAFLKPVRQRGATTGTV